MENMFDLIILIIIFIFLSGVLAMVDAALLSVSRVEIEEQILKKLPGSQASRIVHHKITRAVVIVVILTNSINVLGPILIGQKAIELYGNAVIGLITAILAFGTIIFSEIIPKSLGSHYAPLISRIASPFVLVFIYVLYPLVIVLEKMAVFFQSGKRKIGTEAQIRSLVTIGRKAGHIEQDEGQLIHRAFILNDKFASDIMTPLKDIAGLKYDENIRSAAQKVFKYPYSRYPVFGSSIHDTKGIIMSYDILEALANGKDEEPITSIVREGLIVKANMQCDQLIMLFRDRHIHLAIVQDNEHTVGLVTMEDVLEELIGEIEDETDVEE
jgi:CBS domain containing-hemolysin-like protein